MNFRHFAIILAAAALLVGCQKEEPASSDIFNGHEYVDLGLPSGTLWATCNVGANLPEEYGDYFAWGETVGYYSGKRDFSITNYKWCNGTHYSMTKYCTNPEYGIVDNKIVLDLSDDAARANWGGQWRMPSRDEMYELYANCKMVYGTFNGVNGMVATSKLNNRSIFLPASGWVVESLDAVGVEGAYWTNSLLLGESYDAFCLVFDSSTIVWFGPSRDTGLTVRPVIRVK